MKIYQLYFFGNILIHLAIFFGFFSDTLYSINWSEDFQNGRFYKLITSFFIGGTFISGFKTEYIVPFFSGKNLAIFVSWWLYFTGLVQLRNTYKMMSELEYPKHKNRSAKVNFLVMIFFFITSILGYGLLLQVLSENAYVVQFLTFFRKHMLSIFNLNFEILAVMQEPVMNYIPFHMAIVTAYYYKTKYFVNDFVIINIQNWIMPWLLFIIYICLGMNNELNAFYDYTLMHMLSGIVIGRVYVFLAYEKKLLAAN